MSEPSRNTGGASIELLESGHRLVCGGDWSVHGISGLRVRLAQLAWPTTGELLIDFSQVAQLDTAGVWALHHLLQARHTQGVVWRITGMRPEHEALLQLVGKRAPQTLINLDVAPRISVLQKLGQHGWRWVEQTLGMLSFIGENVEEEITRLKQEKGKNILMFGSPTTAYTLMRHNLIDDYWLFVNPVTIGEGIPLFSGTKSLLKIVETKALASGVVALHYEKEG